MSDNNSESEQCTKIPPDGGCVVTDELTCILGHVSVGSDELERLFTTLSNRRRRFTLYHLIASGQAVVERAALADAILAGEQAHEQTGETPAWATVVSDLHHRVLPRLQEDGYIDYDSRHGTVRYKGPPKLATCLNIIRTFEQSGPE